MTVFVVCDVRKIAATTPDGTDALSFRLDHNVWDAWLYPEGTQSRPARLTRNRTSYEWALMAVFRAMGGAMPEEFEVSYLVSWPRKAPEGVDLDR